MGNLEKESLRLLRAEVRGVFVIGILAMLLGLRLDPAFGEKFRTAVPLSVLLIYWGLHIAMMAVAVSFTSPTKRKLDRYVWFVADRLFDLGIVMMALLALSGFISFFKQEIGFFPPWVLGLLTLIVALFGFIVELLSEFFKTRRLSRNKLEPLVVATATAILLTIPLFFIPG